MLLIVTTKKETKKVPQKQRVTPTKRPRFDFGQMSPYPVVVMVMTTFHMVFLISQQSYPLISDRGPSKILSMYPKMTTVSTMVTLRNVYGISFIIAFTANQLLASHPFMWQTRFDLGFMNFDMQKKQLQSMQMRRREMQRAIWFSS